MTADVPKVEAHEEARVAPWRTPPRWLLHGPLAVMLLLLLWSMSLPGYDFWVFSIAVPAILGLGAVWGVRLIGWTTLPVRPTGRGWYIAPTMVVLTIVLLATGVPLRTRFELARGDFDQYVADLEPMGDFDKWVPIDAPNELGNYEILFAYQVGENVIIYESTGAFLRDAGFAYLPSGPHSDLETVSFASPSFQGLGGGWYSWTASGWDW